MPYLLQMLQWWVRAGLGAMHFLQMETPVRSFLACAQVRRDLYTLKPASHTPASPSPVTPCCLPTLHCPSRFPNPEAFCNIITRLLPVTICSWSRVELGEVVLPLGASPVVGAQVRW